MTVPKVPHPQPEHPRQPPSELSPPKSHLNVTKAIIILKISFICQPFIPKFSSIIKKKGQTYINGKT